MTKKSHDQEITLAADEMIVRYSHGAARVAADRANSAHHRGETAKCDFWQRVCTEINRRNCHKACIQKQIATGDALMDDYRDVFSALAK